MEFNHLFKTKHTKHPNSSMVEQFWKQKRPGFESQFGLNVLFWYAEIGTCISETRRKVNIFLQFIY